MRLPGRFLQGTVATLIAACLFAPLSAGVGSASDVHVGLAIPLTGRMAPAGLVMRSALETAVAEANAKGGVSGTRIELVVADDGCSGATAEGSAASLIAESPAVVIGHPCSGAATKAASRYGAANVLLIAVGARHPDVTAAHGGQPILRLAGRDDRQGQAAARWLSAHARERPIAIVHDRTGYARAIADRAKAALEARDGTPVAVHPITSGNREYETTVAAIANARAGAILFAGFADEAAILLSGLAARGLEIPFLGTDSLATAAFAEAAARTPMPVEILLPAGPQPRIASTDAPNDPDDTQGSEPRRLAAYTRAAFEAWLTTARRIGTTDPLATYRALRDTQTDTATLGPLRFDENGDLVGEDFEPAAAAGSRWVRRP